MLWRNCLMLHVWRLIQSKVHRHDQIFLQHPCANKETLSALVSVHLFVRVTLNEDAVSVRALRLSRLDLWIEMLEIARSNLSWTSFAW